MTHGQLQVFTPKTLARELRGKKKTEIGGGKMGKDGKRWEKMGKGENLIEYESMRYDDIISFDKTFEKIPPSLDVSLVDGGLGITGIPSRRRFSNGVR